MRDFLEKYISQPNLYVVLGILVLSVVLMSYSVWSGNIIGLEEDNIFTGRVMAVVSETEQNQNAGDRSALWQELMVEVELGETKTTKSVSNDFIPVTKGDKVYVQGSLQGEPEESFYVVDVIRHNGLLWLALIFVTLTWVVGGKKGFYAITGLVFSFLVIFLFIIPRILGGMEPILAGLAGAVIILLVTLYVAHGFNRKSLSALLGIALTLLMVGLFSHFVVDALHFSGFSGEESVYLNAQTQNSINLVGLLVAGIIIAAIGVLDDIAVTQAAAVFSLASINSELRGIKLFQKAMEVGRDHISAVVNTLVLAYTGAALPLLLLLTVNRFPLGFTLNGEIISEEIVRTLLSSSGLVLAVPITTFIAVWLQPKTKAGQ